MREVFQHSLMITSFVFTMMLVIEYLNVLSSGNWQCRLRDSRWGQYVFAAMLGAAPGCLGAFTVVSLYSHGAISLGALVTVMISTSGDEAFFMLAMIPDTFIWITLILVAVGVLAGWLTDLISHRKISRQDESCDGLELHAAPDCVCFSLDNIVPQLKSCTLARGSLCIFLAIFIISIVLGVLGPQEWNWIRVTLLLLSVMGLFIVITVPEHFLEEHLWKHVVKKHLHRIFLWTLGTLMLLHFVQGIFNFETWIRESGFLILLIACLVGIIPESGPHLVFVTMYAQGLLPVSVLLANSIVQDGHGMLPLLAHSRRDFFTVKTLNFIVGIVVGLIGFLGGW